MSLRKIKITYPQHICAMLMYLIVKILYINTVHEYIELFYLEESLSN